MTQDLDHLQQMQNCRVAIDLQLRRLSRAMVDGGIPEDEYEDKRATLLAERRSLVVPEFSVVVQQGMILGNFSDSWVEVQPLMVQNTHTGDLAVFHVDGHGQIVSMAISSDPSFIFIRMPWYGTWVVKNGVIFSTFLIFLSVLIGGLVSLIRALRRRNTDKGTLWSSGRLARWTALALSVVGMIFLVALPMNEFTTWDLTKVYLVAPWPIAALALPVVVLAAMAWWKRCWKPAGRIHYTIIALAALALLWFEIYWGFLYLGD